MKPSMITIIPLLFACLLNRFPYTWAQQTSCNTATNYCFQVILPAANATSDQNHASFRLEAPSNVGWVGLGIGSSMLQAYIMIAWPNSDNSITISQRRATSYNEPHVTNQQSDLTLDPSSGITNGKMVAIINRPLSVSGSTLEIDSTQSFVWAVSNTSPGSASPDASLTIHDVKGSTTMSLSSDAGNSNTGNVSLAGNSGLTRDQKLIISHGAVMFVAYLLSAPTAIYIARFGRRVMPTLWFHLHWKIQVFVTTTLAIIGFTLINIKSKPWGSGSIKTAHTYIGNIIFYGTIAQVILGWIHHRLFKADRGYVPWWTRLHWWVGRILVLLALVQAPFGFKCYGAPNGIYIVYYIVVGVWVAAFLGLSARSYMEQKQRQSELEKTGY